MRRSVRAAPQMARNALLLQDQACELRDLGHARMHVVVALDCAWAYWPKAQRDGIVLQ